MICRDGGVQAFHMVCGLLLLWHLGFQLFRLHRRHGRLILGYLEVSRQRCVIHVRWSIQCFYAAHFLNKVCLFVY